MGNYNNFIKRMAEDIYPKEGKNSKKDKKKPEKESKENGR